MRGRFIGVAALAVGLLGAAPAPPASYLGEAGPDTYAILPPPPASGTPQDEADRGVFRATRALKDTPRWTLAQNDVDESRILKDMACAVGAELNRDNAPGLSALLVRMREDVRRAVNRPKETYRRPRPYLSQEGPICVDRTLALAASPDYPSGHSTWGWSVGLVLAELAPDRATQILGRARAFGESRVVCGVHNASSVEAGRANASIVVAALHGDPAFRRDLDAARQEVAAARKAGPTPDAGMCRTEAGLTAKSPY